MLVSFAAMLLVSAPFEEAKSVEAAKQFFSVAASNGHRTFSVTLLQVKMARQQPTQPAELGSNIASNIQHQLLCLLYDKVVRAKHTLKYRQLLDLCRAQR